jgi:hypothetical protein
MDIYSIMSWGKLFFKGLRPFNPANTGGVRATFDSTNMGKFRGGVSPSLFSFPFPFEGEGEGDKGDRVDR